MMPGWVGVMLFIGHQIGKWPDPQPKGVSEYVRYGTTKGGGIKSSKLCSWKVLEWVSI